MEDVPDWLPTDWSMVIQTKKSGNSVGKKYKCYIAPNTGYKYYSKREVFSYLETGKRRSHASELKEEDIGTRSTKSASKVMMEKHPAEGLTLGCSEEIKVTQLESELSERDIQMRFTKSGSQKHPIKGLPTEWIKEMKVAQLEPVVNEREVVAEKYVEERLPPEWCKKIKDTQLGSELNERDIGVHPSKSAKVVVEKHIEEGLPPGWIKEIKVTRLANRTRKDPYYIDPVTGYEFRSKKDVFRYLKSGDIQKCKIIPKMRQISGLESIDGKNSPPTAAKRRKIGDNATRRCLFTVQSSGSGKTVDNELVLESSVVEQCLPLSSIALDHAVTEQQPSGKPHDACIEGSELISVTQGQGSRGLEGMEEKMVRDGRGIVSSTAANVSPEKEPLERSNSVIREGSELLSVAQQEPEDLTHAKNGLNSAASAKTSPEKQLSGKNLGKHKKKAQLCTGNVPRRASKRLAELRAKVAPNLEMSERSPLMVANQSIDLEAYPATAVNPSSCNLQAAASIAATPHISIGSGVLLDENSSKEGDLLIGKLESEVQSTEKPDAPLVLPFGDSWPDPCLEFAFKTLTGAISVDDSLVIEEYFQQNQRVDQDQSRSSFTLPNLGLGGSHQTDIMFQFSTSASPTCKQHSPGNTTFTPLGNCGAAVSGECALPYRNLG